MLQAPNGNLYGTTAAGGSNNVGTVFKITPGGALTTLHNFDTTDGAAPLAALTQGTDGNFYGTTDTGGANGYGTIFAITPGGTLKILYSLRPTDGANPIAGLIQATDGNFYGTTSDEGPNFLGTIFRITPGGTLTTMYSFSPTDGQDAEGGLVQGTDGNLYGTTTEGGTFGAGIVFSLATGLGPFVKTVPTSGSVAANVTILGSDLTGATSVSFGGAPAAFTVVSASEIATAVPAGATSGKVQVTTPSATLLSNVAFKVTP